MSTTVCSGRSEPRRILPGEDIRRPNPAELLAFEQQLALIRAMVLEEERLRTLDDIVVDVEGLDEGDDQVIVVDQVMMDLSEEPEEDPAYQADDESDEEEDEDQEEEEEGELGLWTPAQFVPVYY